MMTSDQVKFLELQNALFQAARALDIAGRELARENSNNAAGCAHMAAGDAYLVLAKFNDSLKYDQPT